MEHPRLSSSYENQDQSHNRQNHRILVSKDQFKRPVLGRWKHNFQCPDVRGIWGQIRNGEEKPVDKKQFWWKISSNKRVVTKVKVDNPSGGTPLFYLTNGGCPLPTTTLVLRVKNRGSPHPTPPVLLLNMGVARHPPPPLTFAPNMVKILWGLLYIRCAALQAFVLII